MLQETLEKASQEARKKRLFGSLGAIGILAVAGISYFAISNYQEAQHLRQQLAARQAVVPSEARSFTGARESATEAAANERLRRADDQQVRANEEAQLPDTTSSVPDGPKNQDSPTSAPAAETHESTIASPTLLPPPIQTGQPATEIVSAPPAGPNASKGLSASRQAPPTTSVAVLPKPSGPEIDESVAKQREAFKVALKAFETDLEPQISTDAFSQWNRENQSDALFLKNAAISAFSAGDFIKANESINKAATIATDALSEKDAAFAAALGAAAQAKANDDFDRAQPQIQRALALEPTSEKAKKLSTEIAKLPEILKHLRLAGVAKAENNLEAEHRHLAAVTTLDPSRADIRERVERLAVEMKEIAFSRHISSGLTHVDAGNLKNARASLSAAKKVFPKRPEVRILDSKVAALSNEIETQKALAAATIAAARDDWATALSFYKDATTRQAANQIAVDGVATATEVLALDAEVSKHLSAPHRLRSKNVERLVVALLNRADKSAGRSQSLDEKTRKLRSALAAYVAEVEVRVVSDGLSFISVKGVGQVGITKSRIIKLRPGSYTFESKRTGFKSKIQNVEIPPTKSFSVEIFCDERI